MLQSTSPRDGSLVQLTVDEPCIDSLCGHQRIQISILHYPWRTESFRKVSSGLLGVLAMTSAVGIQHQVHDSIPMQTVREQPLQIDATAAKEIYRIVEPHLRLTKLGNDQRLILTEDKKARISRQLKRRDDDGIWRDAGKS